MATPPQVQRPPGALPASSYLQRDGTQRHQVKDADYEGRWGRDGSGQVLLQPITGLSTPGSGSHLTRNDGEQKRKESFPQ